MPVFGMCYGFQADGPRRSAARWRRPALASTAGPAVTVSRSRAPCSPASRPRTSCGCRTATRSPRRPAGFDVLASTAATPVAAFEDVDARTGRRAVAPRGAAHRARPAGARALPARHRRLPADLDDGQHRRGAGRARSASRSATGQRDLRPVRRRRLRGRGGDRAARHRRPAHLRLRRPRADAQGRDRAGRARLRGRDRRRSTWWTPRTSSSTRSTGSATRRRSARSSAASSSGSSRRPRCEVFGDAGLPARRSRSSSRARSTPTWSSPAAAPAPPTSSPTTTSAGCPTTCEFELVEPLRTLFKDEVRAGRRAARACPPTIVWRQPFPGPGLGIRIIGEVTRERLDILREADAIAREELTAAGLDRDIWQFPVVLLGRRPLGRRPGRRPHLRPPGRAAAGHLRGRDDRRLGPAAVRRARADLDPDHQRGAPRSTGSPSTSPASRPAPSSGSRSGSATARSWVAVPAAAGHDGDPEQAHAEGSGSCPRRRWSRSSRPPCAISGSTRT